MNNDNIEIDIEMVMDMISDRINNFDGSSNKQFLTICDYVRPCQGSG